MPFFLLSEIWDKLLLPSEIRDFSFISELVFGCLREKPFSPYITNISYYLPIFTTHWVVFALPVLQSQSLVKYVRNKTQLELFRTRDKFIQLFSEIFRSFCDRLRIFKNPRQNIPRGCAFFIIIRIKGKPITFWPLYVIVAGELKNSPTNFYLKSKTGYRLLHAKRPWKWQKLLCKTLNKARYLAFPH